MTIESLISERDPTMNDGDFDGSLEQSRSLGSIKSKRRTSTGFIRISVGISILVFMAIVVTVTFTHCFRKDKLEQEEINIDSKNHKDHNSFKIIFNTNWICTNPDEIPKLMNADEISQNLKKTFSEGNVEIMNLTLLTFPMVDGQLEEACDDSLPIYYLEMTVLTSSNLCDGKVNTTCKTQLEKYLRDQSHELLTRKIRIKLEGVRSNRPSIQKLCSLIHTGDKIFQPIIKASRVGFNTKYGRTSAYDYANNCALCINRVHLVQMDGEHQTRIYDDVKLSISSDIGQYQPSLSVTVLENSNYQLRVKLDCGNEWSNPCSRSLSVTVWVDYNDNGYDDGESFLMRGPWTDSDILEGEYIRDIHIPTIDGMSINGGNRMMRVTVAASNEYQRRCGAINYQETRNYTMNIIQKVAPTTLPPLSVCELPFLRILSVIMAGEKGTEIRDDLPRSSATSLFESEHHQAVTVFENTIYLIRVQLDCRSQLNTELTSTGCNLAQDVYVAIDRNNDGIYDESEMGTPYRWPVASYMNEGIYDLQLHVPDIYDTLNKHDTHRMSIMVLPSTHYVRNCGYRNYNESREYEVTIIPVTRRSEISNIEHPVYNSEDNTCSSDVSKIVLVVMASEYRTQIRDDASTAIATENDPQHERHSKIILYADTVYLLRIQLECRSTRGKETARVNCSLPHDVNAWIDMNDDGLFEESENAAPYRWPLRSYVPDGVYDLQIYVPNLDQDTNHSGPHTLRVEVTSNKNYRDNCGNDHYRENRDYGVTIVRYKTDPEDIHLSNLKLSDNVCFQENSKIVLVIMTGEIGTHIRDDTELNTVISSDQDRHHIGITLYENKAYRIRIQLDCNQSSSRASYHNNCNLVQDINVFIDLNNDDVFDESESCVSNRRPLYSSVGLGIYDLNMDIPKMSEHSLQSDIYKMRVVVKSTEEYVSKCNSHEEPEIREYSVKIISSA